MRRFYRYGLIGGLLGVALGVGGGIASAQNQKTPTGGFDVTHPEDRELYRAYLHRADMKFDEVQPFFKADRASHVANGVALRNRTRGYIHSRGVPLKSNVLGSFLLWNLSDSSEVGADSMPVLFDGNVVAGRKTADNTDPCWGRAGNHSYLADVTRYTDQTGGPNQDYEVTLPFSGATSTTGQDPWAPSDSAKVILEGASLVVIYRNETTVGSLFLFAPPGDNMFMSSASYVLPSPGLGRGLFTMIGGDGQRGISHSNIASNELTFFDGTQIAGPPVAASDWDGSDGLTLPQLWDTHTHEVKIANPVSRVDYTQAADCLVPVGFVLDQE
jgi:hypothetical protein